VVIVWASCFIYISLYYLYLPQITFTRPIFLQHDPLCKQDYCQIPYAEIDLADKRSPISFARGQQYEFAVKLDLPESDVNWDQGQFMVRMKLIDKSGRIVYNVARAAILTYKSPLLRILNTFMFSFTMLFGWHEEKQSIYLTMVDNFLDDSDIRISTLRIEIEVARKIQIYHSQLFIEAKLSGLRYYMYHHPYLSGLVGTVTIATFLSILLALNLYRFIFSDFGDEDKIDDDDDDKMDPLGINAVDRIAEPDLSQSQLTGDLDPNSLDSTTDEPNGGSFENEMNGHLQTDTVQDSGQDSGFGSHNPDSTSMLA